ncbi:MAG: 50S ribosomal protein L28 [bacterium]|nr:50S ribosomal protein L28 [bacterium]
MAKSCQVCSRGTQSGASRSHSMIQTRRKFSVNMQVKTIDGKRVKICTKCIKTSKKKTRV